MVVSKNMKSSRKEVADHKLALKTKGQYIFAEKATSGLY